MSDIPEDAVEAVAETHRGTLLSAQGSISIRCSCDWNGTLDHWGDHLLAAYQEWMRSTGHVPDTLERIWLDPDTGESFTEKRAGLWGNYGALYRVRPSETDEETTHSHAYHSDDDRCVVCGSVRPSETPQ